MREKGRNMTIVRCILPWGISSYKIMSISISAINMHN